MAVYYYNSVFAKQCVLRIKRHELLLLKNKLSDELLPRHLIHKKEEYGVITNQSDECRGVCGYITAAWCHQLI